VKTVRLLFFFVFTGISLARSGLAAPQSPPQLSARRPPQAKTQAEYNDYNADYALTGGEAAENAANEFAAKYPQSELRVYLYSKAMHEYQKENNPARVLAMGEKVLALDPDDSIALVLTATVLADSLSDTSSSHDQIVAETKRNANRALATLDIGFTPPPSATPDQIQSYKSTLQSMAYSALGIVELKTGDNADAEKDLRAAADLSTAQPDPYIWYHLALAQDHLASASSDPETKRKGYGNALASAKMALQYAGSNADLARLAQVESDRLQILVGSHK
jgi:tetratricopeptide (TPR) repeat protein